ERGSRRRPRRGARPRARPGRAGHVRRPPGHRHRARGRSVHLGGRRRRTLVDPVRHARGPLRRAAVRPRRARRRDRPRPRPAADRRPCRLGLRARCGAGVAGHLRRDHPRRLRGAVRARPAVPPLAARAPLR
ncbi:MAG: putative membrane protein, partial [uncultured Pseudonocardia sp.]